jgi:hypothetical protein
VRIAAWLSIVFAVLSAIAIFLPGIELQVGGVTLGKRAKVSLYTAARDRDVVKTLIERYHALGGKATGEKAADFILAHAHKHAAKAHVDDARDAMSSLDEVHGSDIQLAGRALVGITLGYIAVVVAFVLVMFGATDEAKFSRRRAIAGVAVALVLAAVAVAVHVGWSMGLAEANDDIGGEPFVLGIGADLMPVGALAALGSAIAALVLLLRAKRDAKPA